MERTIILDIEKCVGCGACVVACEDQNDLFPEKGQPALRRIYQMEDPGDGRPEIRYASAGCRHCENSPCLVGCPTAAIYRDVRTDAVRIDRDRCIGCHSCALACPFGVPRYDLDDKMFKCDMCSDRVKEGLKPVCVKVCPFGALEYADPNAAPAEKERAYLNDLVGETRAARDERQR